MPNHFTSPSKIIFAILSGCLIGILLHSFAGSNQWLQKYLIQGCLYILAGAFVNVLKMMVIPWVVCAIITAVNQLQDLRTLTRIGLKTLCWSALSSVGAVSTALLISTLIEPGTHVHLPTGAHFNAPDVPLLTDNLINIIPYNPFTAFAEGNLLQIIFFSMLVAAALKATPTTVQGLVNLFEQLNGVMHNLLAIVVKLTPLGIFCVTAYQFAMQDLALLTPILDYCVVVILAFITHTLGLLSCLLIFFAKVQPWRFFKKLCSAQVFAFSTSNVNATLPTLLYTLERMGIKKSVLGIALPLGTTLNLDGTAIIQGTAALFIAHLFGMDLTVMDYLSIIGIVLIALISTAGIPGSGLILLTMLIKQLGLPLETVGLLIGAERLLATLGTVVHVTSSAVLTGIIARSEAAFDDHVFNDPKA